MDFENIEENGNLELDIFLHIIRKVKQAVEVIDGQRVSLWSARINQRRR